MVEDTDTITNAMVPIEAIQPHPRNYRSHPESQIAKLKSSHKRFSQYRSVVLWQRPHGEYIQVAGHGIVQAMRERGVTRVRADILPEDTPQEDIEGILAADNLLPEGAEDDSEALAHLLQEQYDAGYDLAALGSDEESLRQMLASLGDAYLDGEQEEGDEDVIPEAVETRCKVGDVWQLGKHRIICADALIPSTYDILLQGIRLDAIIADPPYGMRLDADFSSMKAGGNFAERESSDGGNYYSDVRGDDKDFDAALFSALFSYVKEQLWFGADYYSSTLEDTMHSGCWLVWDKRVDENLDRMYGSCFELIWSKKKHKRDIIRQKWAGLFGTEHEPQRGRQHPTQKPVRLLEDIITRYTDEGQIILDPFLGSGTTLISAERTGRVCYGCELSPAYCDICISRYEAESGQAATLLERAEATHA